MPGFDVFLSHRSEDDEAIVRIAKKLRDASIEPWIDNWYCEGGGRWQSEIADGIKSSKAFAVFLGGSGMSGWVDEELAVALSRAAKDRNYRVFLVLLPNAPEPFDRSTLPAFLNTRGSVDLRKGYERADQFKLLTDAILGIIAGPPPKPSTTDVSPYRGLEVFDEEHADFYFGRTAEIQHLVEKLKGSRFLAVVGPSGSGKSSLVRAGLIPALRSGQIAGSECWVIGKMRPGPHPLAALASELVRSDPDLAMGKTVDELQDDPRTLDHIARLIAAPAGPENRFLLIVDQFEELFTLCQDDAERSAFIATLLHGATIPGGQCIVVVTLRADFYTRCAAYPELAALIAGQQTLIGALDEQNLHEVVVEPAWRAGLQFEDGLVDTILDDVSNQPGSLPLLEHALQGLWLHRRANLLTLEGYLANGRVAGSIAKTAESEFEELDPSQQQLARQIFLRLTQPGEGTEDTRRRASIAELVPDDGNRASIDNVIDHLIAARLITASTSDIPPYQPQVDVAHEALIRAWPRLRTWIDEDRDGLRIHRRLSDDALEWQRMGYDEGQLYRGTKLIEATEFAERQPATLNALEKSLLTQSAALRERERAEANARLVARERNQKRVAAGLLVGLLISLLLGGFAWLQRGKALEESQNRATAIVVAQAETNSRTTAVAVAQQESSNREAAEQTAVAEAGRAQTAEAVANSEAVRAANAQSAADANAQTAQAESLIRATAEADSAVQAANALAAQATAQSNADLAETERQIAEQNQRDSNARELAAIADSNNVRIDQSLLLGLEAMDTSASVVDPFLIPKILEKDPRFAGLLLPPDPALSLQYGFCMLEEGEVIAALGRDESIYLWDPNTSKLIATLGEGGNSSVSGRIACQKHGSLLASSATSDGSIEFWDIDKKQSAGKIDLGVESGASFAFDPTGETLVIWESTGMKFWNVASQKEVLPPWFGSQIAPLTPSSATFSGDGAMFAIGDKLGQLQVWDPHSGKILRDTEKIADGEIGPIRMSRDGSLIAMAIDGTQLAVLGPEPGAEPLIVKDFGSIIGAQVSDIAFSPDGHWLAASTVDGQITLIDLSKPGYPEGKPIDPVVEGSGGWGLDFRPDAPNILATLGGDGSIALWDLDGAGPIAQVLPGFDEWAAGLAVSPDSRTLAVISCFGEVSLWDLELLQPLGTLAESPAPAGCTQRQSVAFSHNGAMLAAGFADGSIEVINLADHSIDNRLPGTGSTIMTLGFSADDSMLVSLDQSAALSFWTLGTGDDSEPATFHAFDADIFATSWSPDGRYLVTGSTDDATLKVWDIESPGNWSELPGGGQGGAPAFAVTFGGNDSVITGVDVLGQLLQWTKSGETWNRELLGQNRQSGPVSSMVWLGNQLDARITYLNELGIYDPEGIPMIEVQPELSDGSLGLTLVLTPDGKHLISGHSDRIVVWDLESAAWASTACQIAGRNFSATEWEHYFGNKPYRRTCADYSDGYGVESSATPALATPVSD